MLIFIGWTAADTASWRQFFDKSGKYAVNNEGPVFSITQLRPQAQDPGPVIAAPVHVAPLLHIPEPLVCSTHDAASAWTAGRARAREAARSSAMPGDIL